MKKIFTKLMLWAVAATALVSCENKIDESTPVVELTQTVTLTAEKPVEVRTEMIEGVPYWNAEDAIGVYTQTEKDADYYKFTNDSKETTLTTSFTGTTAVANTLFVFYPYNSCNGISADGAKVLFPANQEPTATSFDGKADIMLAKPVTLDEEGKQLSDLEFARVGAIVKIVLKGDISSLAGQHISSLTMTAANNLVGRAYLDVENQELGKLYDSESKSVMATYTSATQYEVNGENATYVIVYPQTLEAGTDKTLTITASTEDYDIEKVITVPAGGIDLVQGAVTTLNVSLAADHITKRETVEWVNNAYNLVPSTTNLTIGDKVVFVAADFAKAMGAQNSNNRASVVVTKNDNKTVDFNSEVTIFTVVEGTTEGTFAFQSSEGYICAVSSSSNHLRQEATLSANSSWSVNIQDGIATVKAQGTNTRNWLRFNSTNNPPIFSCYASGQADVAIYKLVGEYVAEVPAITMSVDAVSINHDATSGEATVTTKNGDGWAISATTTANWVSDLAYSNGKITFKATANETESERKATVTVTATKADYDDVTTTFEITQGAKPAEGGDEGGVVVDVLNRALTGATSTTYIEWSGKTSNSTAVYKGNSAGGNSAIQLRSSNSNSGIVTTASGGTARKVVVTWQSGTSNGRTLDIYGKNTAYSAATDLYNSAAATKGTKLGSIVMGTSTELTISGDYAYIGLRSNSGAMYVTEIQITWETGEGGGSTPEPEPATPVLSINPTTLSFDAAAGSKTIACTIENEVSGVNVTATESVDWLSTSVSGKTITVTATENTTTSERTATVTIAYTGAESKTVTVSQAAAEVVEPEQPATKVWTLVTDASTLKAGDQIIIASNTKNLTASATITSQYMETVSTTFSADKKTITSVGSGTAILTLGGSAGAWTLTNESGKKLGATAVKKVAWGSGTTTWAITISSNNATIQNTTSSYGRFLHNVSSPRFTTYTSNTSSSMLLPQIYRLQ